MPVGYHISPDDGLITMRTDGAVAIEDILSAGKALLSDECYDPTLPQLLDFRGTLPLPDGDLDGLNEFVQQQYRDKVQANVAVVIDDHLESRHCADIFLVTCAIPGAELFADYDLAVRWLMRQAFAMGVTSAG